ncbi:MAG: PAS domain S-box protein [Flavipsychrobacter sp.]|nr:PAS domain S-box protein [Flavipsychrobacter sp.]
MKFEFEKLTDPEEFIVYDFISIITPDRIRKFTNKAYNDFLQKQESELVGKDFTNGFPEEQVIFFDNLIKSLSPADSQISIVQRINISGRQDIISWRVSGIFDTNGKLTEILNVGRHINEYQKLKNENAELLATLNAYRRAIDANIICTITDAKGVIIYTNENFCKVSQYSREEIIGNTHRLVNSGYHPQSFFSDLWSTIKTGKMWVGEIKNKAKDGSFYWVNSVIIPITTVNNVITGFLSIRILINEQKKREEERTQYLKSLENMLFMVSHEIRKPITGIQGLISLIEDKTLLNDNEYTQTISYLQSSATELDEYSRKLNDQIQKNMKTVNT